MWACVTYEHSKGLLTMPSLIYKSKQWVPSWTRSSWNSFIIHHLGHRIASVLRRVWYCAKCLPESNVEMLGGSRSRRFEARLQQNVYSWLEENRPPRWISINKELCGMWKLEGVLTTPSKSFGNIWTSLSLTTLINTTTLDTTKMLHLLTTC